MLIFDNSVVKISIDYIILKTETFMMKWDMKGELIEEEYYNDRTITYLKESKQIKINGLYFIYNLENYLNNRCCLRLTNEFVNLTRYQELDKFVEGYLINPDLGIFFYIIYDEVNAVTASISNITPASKHSIEYIKKNLSRLKTEAEKLRMNPRNYILDLLSD